MGIMGRLFANDVADLWESDKWGILKCVCMYVFASGTYKCADINTFTHNKELPRRIVYKLDEIRLVAQMN